MPIQIVYVTAALMAASLFPMPGQFTGFLNVMVFGTFAWGAYRNFEPFGPQTFLAVAYLAFAIAFNPISPVIIPELILKVLTVAGAALLLVTGKRFIR